MSAISRIRRWWAAIIWSRGGIGVSTARWRRWVIGIGGGRRDISTGSGRLVRSGWGYVIAIRMRWSIGRRSPSVIWIRVIPSARDRWGWTVVVRWS